MGYILGGIFLDRYVDFDKVSVSEIGIAPTDARWVGAWWLGFVVSCVSALPVSLFLLCFPKRLPTWKEAYADRKDQVHQQSFGSDKRAYSDNFMKNVRDTPVALKTLFTNSVLLFLTIGGITEGLVLAGFSTFVSKFIQNYFNKTASQAAIIFGIIAICSSLISQFGSGLLCRLMKLEVKGMLNMMITCTCICVAASCAFFFTCDALPLAGVTRPYPETNSSVVPFVIEAQCISGCQCTTNSYEPVCGADNLQYFSACHAGCTNQSVTNGITTFRDCSCIKNSSSSGLAVSGTANGGNCDTFCANLYPFAVLAFVFMFCSLGIFVPALSVTFRILPDKQRAFGNGLKWFFIRYLGTVPGPVIYGAVFDSTCVLFRENTCGTRTNQRLSCWFYDNSELALRLGLLTVALKVMSALSFTAARFFYRPPSDDQSDLSTAKEKSLNGNQAFVMEAELKKNDNLDKDKWKRGEF